MYISKDLKEVSSSFLEFLAREKVHLIAESQIETKATSFLFNPSDTEAYFFGSKRAVSFFLEKYKIPTSSLICCIGKSTAKALNDAGYKVDFVGEHASNPSQVAADLLQFLGSKKLCVLRSNKSMRSIPTAFPAHQVQEICVYETVLKPKRLEEKPDILVFTSPSNVESFLLENSIAATQKIISWGKTTSKYLIERGFNPKVTLQDSNEEEICTFLHTLM